MQFFSGSYSTVTTCRTFKNLQNATEMATHSLWNGDSLIAQEFTVNADTSIESS